MVVCGCRGRLGGNYLVLIGGVSVRVAGGFEIGAVGGVLLGFVGVDDGFESAGFECAGVDGDASATFFLSESALFSAGFVDCDDVVPSASGPDPVSAAATPVPASIAADMPAVTAPAPNYSKNRSIMPSPVPAAEG